MEQACGYSYIYIFLIVVLVGVLVVVSSRRSQCLTQVGSSSKKQLINYNTTWCPHSVRLEPEWDKVTQMLKGSSIEVLNIKCDKTKDKCPKHIRGFPTIALVQGSKMKEYQGARSADEIVAFAKKYA